jgi:SAM-dependent methyltransferase
MKLSRNATLIFHYVLDNLVPPILRDSKWFMYPIMRIACGRDAGKYFRFKNESPFMTETDLKEFYQSLGPSPISERETDLNSACAGYILENIEGRSVLDVGCGRGGLMALLSASDPSLRCLGVDFDSKNAVPGSIVQASLSSLPFPDKSFDTVLCTHVLEHVADHGAALREVLRLAKKRAIIVVPRQREYLYTPDLHVNFMPYMHSFKKFIGIDDAKYMRLKGDFLCRIDF